MTLANIGLIAFQSLHAVVHRGDDLLDNIVATPEFAESIIQVENFELFQQPKVS
jgi:hypothetical protein